MFPRLSFENVITGLTKLYTDSSELPYGAAGMDLQLDPLAGTEGKSVGFLAHALQTAAQATIAFPDDVEVHIAALLHDVGWLLPKPSDSTLLSTATFTDATATAAADRAFIARHDITGSRYLARLGFPPRVCRLVAGHVLAKRYLVTTEPTYAATLSPGSKYTLELQGGRMNEDEITRFTSDPDFLLHCALRRWDEGAKVPDLPTPGWETYVEDMRKLLTSHLFAPFSAQLPGGPLDLNTLVPSEQHTIRTSLDPSGPGYIVVRQWLSEAEIAAITHYSKHVVPALDPALVHHTYEKRTIGIASNVTTVEQAEDVVLSRTEYFAHIHESDTDGVGERLLLAKRSTNVSSRLAELCSILRGNRRMVLYKEKQNYKLAGGTGGYLPHQDYYRSFDKTTGERTHLLADTDVCVCMLAIDRMDDENGAPNVAPFWHTRGSIDFIGSPSLTEDSAQECVDPAVMPWTPVHLSPGDVLIYGNLMPHKSAENHSERDRRALFAVYVDEEHAGSDIRERYYAHETLNRRALGSSSTGGKANQFFTGNAVQVRKNE